MKKKKVEKTRSARNYIKPAVKQVYREEDFVSKDLPFVGATSVYKTYIPARIKIQS